MKKLLLLFVIILINFKIYGQAGYAIDIRNSQPAIVETFYMITPNGDTLSFTVAGDNDTTVIYATTGVIDIIGLLISGGSVSDADSLGSQPPLYYEDSLYFQFTDGSGSGWYNMHTSNDSIKDLVTKTALAIKLITDSVYNSDDDLVLGITSYDIYLDGDTVFGTPIWYNNFTATGDVTAVNINGTTSLQLNGTDINTAGTLTNVAYENQENVFTEKQTFNDTILLDDNGNNTNSYPIVMEANSGGTIETGIMQTLYGANPYIRLSPPNAAGTATPTMDMRSDLVSWFNGGAGINYYFNFNGESNDGTITYMEDEDRFDFDNDVLIGGDFTISGGDTIILIDASGNDSAMIYDDGDTTFFISDNIIKLGNNSLVVETGGDVIVNEQLKSTKATGTSPFTVASTTLVTNLNVDRVDGWHLDQDVSTIGDPTFDSLDITRGTISAMGITATDITTKGYVDGLVQGLKYEAPVISITDRASADSSLTTNRYISISTANGWTTDYIYQWANPGWTETVIADTGTQCHVIDSASNYIWINAWNKMASTQLHNEFQNLSYATAGHTDFAGTVVDNDFTGDTNYFSGNVGIGSTYPSAKLDIVGNTIITSGDLTIATIGNVIQWGDGDTEIYEDSDDKLFFKIGNTIRWNMESNYIQGHAAYSAKIFATASSTGSVAHSFRSDNNTGLHRHAADTVSLVAGGVEAILGMTTGVQVNGDATITGNILKSVEATITASTTQSQGQQPLTKDISEISTVANDNDVVTLPTAVAGLSSFIINNGTYILQIFPASGDDLGAGVNSSTTLAPGANVTFVSYNDTNWETD